MLAWTKSKKQFLKRTLFALVESLGIQYLTPASFRAQHKAVFIPQCSKTLKGFTMAQIQSDLSLVNGAIIFKSGFSTLYVLVCGNALAVMLYLIHYAIKYLCLTK